MNTNTAALNWQTIGKNAHMAKVPSGFIHVMHVGGKVWSVTLNGRVIGKADSAESAKSIATNIAIATNIV